MDRLQKYNQHLLRRAVRDKCLLVAIEVSAGRRFRVTSATWDEYWGHCGPMTSEVSRLKEAWTALISGHFAHSLRSSFVRAYFQLLRTCLDQHARGHDVLVLLRKTVGFETIRVSGDSGGSAAAIVSARHPVYLLSKLANPRAPENPKYLPLVCPCGNPSEANSTFWHYRRIPLVRTNGIQLFVYPPATVDHRPLSHALIGQLFACLTPRTDPWVRERSQSLFDGVFDALVADTASRRLRLLDMACGSAKITLTLCRKAFAVHRKSFDLTLVDVVRGARTIANSFYQNPHVFGNVFFCRENMFEWLDKNSDKPEMRFDAAMLLRACNLFSRFLIEEVSLAEAQSLLAQAPGIAPLDSRALRPAELIESDQLAKIRHGIGRFVFKNGWGFRQFSASDYFKAMRIVMGEGLSGDEDTVYLPIRAFDEDVLVLSSGRSLIASMLEMTKQLLIEDVDLLPSHLERHFRRFGLHEVSVTDMTDRARRRGAAVYRIERKRDGDYPEPSGTQSSSMGVLTN